MTEPVAQELELSADSDPLSEQLVRAVAAREGVDPTALETPLYEVIDGEALDRLFAPTSSGDRAGGRVVFTYYGYRLTVTIDDDPEVRIEDPSSTPSRNAPSADAVATASAAAARSDPEADVHYCADCGWRASARDGYSTSDRSRLAIDHHVETGHTIESSRVDASK